MEKDNDMIFKSGNDKSFSNRNLNDVVDKA